MEGPTLHDAKRSALNPRAWEDHPALGPGEEALRWAKEAAVLAWLGASLLPFQKVNIPFLALILRRKGGGRRARLRKVLTMLFFGNRVEEKLNPTPYKPVKKDRFRFL